MSALGQRIMSGPWRLIEIQKVGEDGSHRALQLPLATFQDLDARDPCSSRVVEAIWKSGENRDYGQG